jgi:hypothetical protein
MQISNLETMFLISDKFVFQQTNMLKNLVDNMCLETIWMTIV